MAAAAAIASSVTATKEHVLRELERREEDRIAADLTRRAARLPDLPAVLSEVVKTVGGLEGRLGPLLFKDFLALHFSSAQPPEEVWSNHPVIVTVVEALARARDEGEIPPMSTRSTADCSSLSGSTGCY